MELHLKIIGILLMVLAFVHIPFPKYFKWKEELKSLSLINRQMMKVHTFFIALMVFLMGLLSFSQADLLVSTELGQIVSLGMAVFWGVRLVFQLFIYSTKLWRGKVFETTMHVLFTALWVYISIVYVVVYFSPSV
ncbi:hypothetical protein J1N09_10200 [Aureitalea sp. L0-47]|uniref:hypothetical protein n=1 Tax=Aureitalea sp. L0-47 TaxID=2816962 RepID=UPI00223800D3|nr:hypothetical protein [Aureitalea sp. L0-47]MCW5520210.1 hypothetical protein [Aureitalea sp. L0-47]